MAFDNLNLGQQWIDMGLEQFFAKCTVLDKSHVQVGIVGEAAERTSADGRLTMGELARIHEFGAPGVGIPPRPLVSAAALQPVAMQQAEKICRTTLDFGNLDAALHEAGQKMSEIMRDNVYHGEMFTPNAPETIRQKGFDHPLIDTSALTDALGYQIVRENGDTVASGAAVDTGVEAFSITGAQ